MFKKTVLGILIACLSIVGAYGQAMGIDTTVIKVGPPPPVRGVQAWTVGVQGTVTYYYWVVAIYPVGHSVPLNGPVAVYNCNSTLDGSNYVTLAWSAQVGATAYAVVRSTTTTFPGSGATAVSASTPNLTINDQANALNAYTYVPSPTTLVEMTVNNRDQSYPQVMIRSSGNFTMAVGGPTNATSPIAGSFNIAGDYYKNGVSINPSGGTNGGWVKYSLLKVANLTLGCANANGCWSVNGGTAVTATNGVTQDVVLFQLPAKGYVHDIRIKPKTACTGATTATTGLGVTGSTTLFQAARDIMAGPGDTNIWDAIAASGSYTAAAVNVVASLVTTVANVDALVAGCAVDYWVNWSVLP
jgi:hypothetical protein